MRSTALAVSRSETLACVYPLYAADLDPCEFPEAFRPESQSEDWSDLADADSDGRWWLVAAHLDEATRG